MKRTGLKPGFKIGLDTSSGQTVFRRVMPFRRAWIAIGILAAMDAVFLFPAITTLGQAIGEWSRLDSLFDLVAAVFLSAWLLGWMIAPILLTTILVLMLFGREVLKAGPGMVEIFLGIPLIGLTASYDVSKMRNLRFDQPPPKSGKAWRGSHLLFDYGANTVAVGSSIRGDEVSVIRSQLESASGMKIRHGEAHPDELKPAWKQEEKPAALVRSTDTGFKDKPAHLTSTSALLLIIANLVPVAGSLFLDWNLADVMVLYWAESAVIGFFNVCKIAVIGRAFALLAGPFFIGHFGGFMAVHFLFIYTIFVKPPDTQLSSNDDLATVAGLFLTLWPALLALFISHAYSFFQNFLGRREYQNRTVNQQMTEPYGRIIFMHLVLIFGGGLSLFLGGPKIVLLLVIILKIFFDLKAHLKQHTRDKVHD